MQFKLAIADVVEVPVKFEVKDGRDVRRFKFSLTCKRADTESWQAALVDERGNWSDAKMREQFRELTTGWSSDQQFVLDEHGKPAEFSGEALDFLLCQPGVLTVVFNSYSKATSATAKN